MVKSKVSIIIPCFNEETTILDILKRCKPYADEIIVSVAKKSTDKTYQIAKDFGATVVTDNGLGKADGMKVGASISKGGILIFIDADGSHIPEDIPSILRCFEEESADVVITSRMRGGSDELHGSISKFVRMILSDIITLIINYRFGLRITDSQNGFRGIKKSVFDSLKLKAKHTEVETEMLMKAAKMKYKICEIPSKELARKGGISKLNILKHGWRYLWVVLSNIFW